MMVLQSLLGNALRTTRAAVIPDASQPKDLVQIGQRPVAATPTLNPSSPPWSADQRPATLVEKRPDGSMRLDGVRWGFTEAPDVKDWKSVFATTTVDPSKVGEVYVLVEPFHPEAIGAHVRLMFEMEPGAQVSGDGGLSDSGIYVSYEARMHEGEKYSPLKGLGKAFRPIYQVGTWSDALQRKTRQKGNAVIRYKLELTRDQKQQLLRNCLDDALGDHKNEWYNTATSSCYDVALRQLDTVLQGRQRIPHWKLDGRLNPMMLDPRNAPSVLFNHGLLASPEGIMVEPDQARFPGKNHQPGIIGRVAGAIGRIPGLRPALRIAGAVAGAVLVPGVVGGIAGALVGQWIGRGLANQAILQAHLRFETSESHFPPGYQGPAAQQPAASTPAPPVPPTLQQAT